MNGYRLLSILVGMAVLGLTWAGDLEPPGPPAPTMGNLQELYDRLDDCTRYDFCGVAKTGQQDCSDRYGNGIDCGGTGQDGESRAGVALQPRFTVNGDGTVTDNLTKLVWLEDADCFGSRTWIEGLADANALATGACGLTDGSVAGNWHLPNVNELQSLIDYGQYNPALSAGHPFTGATSHYYWTSTHIVAHLPNAWILSLYSGYITSTNKENPSVVEVHVWPVR